MEATFNCHAVKAWQPLSLTDDLIDGDNLDLVAPDVDKVWHLIHGKDKNLSDPVSMLQKRAYRIAQLAVISEPALVPLRLVRRRGKRSALCGIVRISSVYPGINDINTSCSPDLPTHRHALTLSDGTYMFNGPIHIELLASSQ